MLNAMVVLVVTPSGWGAAPGVVFLWFKKMEGEESKYLYSDKLRKQTTVCMILNL